TSADRRGLRRNRRPPGGARPGGVAVVAYMPTVRTITVDMSTLAGAATARWYDPTTAAFTTVPGSPIANAGAMNFTPPGPNGDGAGDWVLVLEAGERAPDAQPPPSRTS